MTVNLMVEGMSCAGCVRSVTRAIQRVDQAAQVDVDLDTGRLTIEGALSPDQARQAVEGAGYTAEPAPSDA